MADPNGVHPDPAASGALHRPRRSACADASLRAELERLRAMTVVERIEAALGIKHKFDGLRPVPVVPARP
jgi:hypothetical protein